jgi:Holliday junction DNA helicase RuvB
VLVMPSGFRIDVSTVTFIGATTTEQLEQLGAPLQDRFEIKPSWVPYSDDEMTEIMLGMANRLGFAMSPELAAGLARAAGGTPRLSKRLVKRARDLGPDATAESVLRLVGVDADGLDANHWQYLQALNNMGGRAGLSKLKNILQMSVPMIEDLERLLLLRECIRFEPNGRKITQIGARKLSARRKEAA